MRGTRGIAHLSIPLFDISPLVLTLELPPPKEKTTIDIPIEPEASQQQHCAQPTDDRRNQQSAAIETRHSGRNTGRHTNITGTSSESVHAGSFMTHARQVPSQSALSPTPERPAVQRRRRPSLQQSC
ncbi:hypothetical protein ACLKA6_001140 [Drosophila palustris]